MSITHYKDTIPSASGIIDLGTAALAWNDAHIDKVYLEGSPVTPLQAATKQYVDDKTVESFPTSLTAGSVVFSDGSTLSQDNDNLFWDDVNKRIELPNILITETFQNYNPDLTDIGVEQINDIRGYGVDYISKKLLSRVQVGTVADEVEGAIRNNSGTFQIYLNEIWNDIVINFRFREDDSGAYELEHKPVGFDSWIEVNSGNSNVLDLNGLPIIQQYKTSIGAYQVPLQIDGGTF